VAKQHTGNSDQSFSQAVREALKDADGGGTFSVEQKVMLSPNPGAINFQVTLTKEPEDD
jgi:hypothetical protein